MDNVLKRLDSKVKCAVKISVPFAPVSQYEQVCFVSYAAEISVCMTQHAV